MLRLIVEHGLKILGHALVTASTASTASTFVLSVILAFITGRLWGRHRRLLGNTLRGWKPSSQVLSTSLLHCQLVLQKFPLLWSKTLILEKFSDGFGIRSILLGGHENSGISNLHSKLKYSSTSL